MTGPAYLEELRKRKLYELVFCTHYKQKKVLVHIYDSAGNLIKPSKVYIAPYSWRGSLDGREYYILAYGVKYYIIRYRKDGKGRVMLSIGKIIDEKEDTILQLRNDYTGICWPPEEVKSYLKLPQPVMDKLLTYLREGRENG